MTQLSLISVGQAWDSQPQFSHCPLFSLRLEAWEDPTRLFTPTQYSENPRDDQDHEVPRDSLKCPLQGHRLLRGSCCSYTSSSKTTQEKAILGAQQVHMCVHTHL